MRRMLLWHLIDEKGAIVALDLLWHLIDEKGATGIVVKEGNVGFR